MLRTVTERAIATTKARECLHSIEGCPGASCEDLGRARDLLNRVDHGYNPDTALVDLQQLEVDVWHGNAPHRVS